MEDIPVGADGDVKRDLTGLVCESGEREERDENEGESAHSAKQPQLKENKTRRQTKEKEKYACYQSNEVSSQNLGRKVSTH
jgi:hypothetical protein